MFGDRRVGCVAGAASGRTLATPPPFIRGRLVRSFR